jgi:hypothetical protein
LDPKLLQSTTTRKIIQYIINHPYSPYTRLISSEKSISDLITSLHKIDNEPKSDPTVTSKKLQKKIPTVDVQKQNLYLDSKFYLFS